MSKLYTPEEVAEQLKVPVNTVRIWMRKKLLIGVKLGKYWRIKESDLNKFLENDKGVE